MEEVEVKFEEIKVEAENEDEVEVDNEDKVEEV